MAPGARMCVSCGLDASTERRARAAAEEPSLAGRIAKLAGTSLLGCILSGVGALIGAAIWFAIAAKTGYEIGWIAWGLGFLAGIGMVLGYRDQTTTAGITAAIISVIGIVAAKAAIFIFVIYSVVTGNTSDIDLQRGYVTGMMARDMLRERGVDPGEATEAQGNEAQVEAERRVKQMNDTEVHKKWAEYRKAAEEEAKESKAGAEKNSKPRPTQTADGENRTRLAISDLIPVFFKAMFGALDLLFVGLAVVSAFKIGSGWSKAQE